MKYRNVAYYCPGCRQRIGIYTNRATQTRAAVCNGTPRIMRKLKVQPK